MSYRRSFDSALCYSLMTRINSLKLITYPVSSPSPATIGSGLTVFPARSVVAWLKECRGIVPQLTGLNDLLVKRATDAVALPDCETYLMFRCCSIVILTSLAQLYDIIARSPITPTNESVRFRGICDDTLKDIAKITMDFSKDDYSCLEPILSVSLPTTCTRHGTE